MNKSVLLLALVVASPVFADALSAQDYLAKYAVQVTTRDGPTDGPKAAEARKIVVLAGDMKNGGIQGVVNGITEAAAKIGWEVTALDGAGSVQSRAAIFGQALAPKPDGIVITGFDAVEQQVALDQATAAGIPMVSFHAGPAIGPDEKSGVFADVSTDPMKVSAAAAVWAFVDARGAPGAVIYTDSTYAIAKAGKIKATIKELGGTVLGIGRYADC